MTHGPITYHHIPYLETSKPITLLQQKYDDRWCILKQLTLFQGMMGMASASRSHVFYCMVQMYTIRATSV